MPAEPHTCRSTVRTSRQREYESLTFRLAALTARGMADSRDAEYLRDRLHEVLGGMPDSELDAL
jgi:hypothetical protein